MKRDKFAVSPEQRVTLSRLRVLLAERGYIIFPVAEFFRQTGDDFIAMPKMWPRQFLRVRPVKSGKIMIQSFAARTQYRGLAKYLREASGFISPVRWSGSQLPYANVRPDWWSQYIPEECRIELEQLGLH